MPSLVFINRTTMTLINNNQIKKVRRKFKICVCFSIIICKTLVKSKENFIGFIYYFIFDDMAFIFKMLKKDTTREDIINALLAEYPDATQEAAAESVDELVEQLRKAELLS